MGLAVAGMAGSAASAQGPGTTVWGGGVETSRAPTAPASARPRAEAEIRKEIGDEGATFRSVKASAVASIRHGGLGGPIDGPVSVVCGQYAKQGQSDYSWFFVAIKRGEILWTASAVTGQPGEAYASCEGAGLTN
ncbi:MAG TPA: hypothetical protein VGG29_11665 [Caulobacteraceae bacterium]